MGSAHRTCAPWLHEPRGPVFRAARLSIGRFRRHPSEPDFADTGPTDGTLLVFPRLPVRIAQAGRRAVVADPTVVMLYNRGQEYRRAAISPEGDRCDWFAFAPADVADALRALGSERDPRQPFTEAWVPAPAPLVLRARALFAAAARGAEPLEIEEGALALLRAALVQPGALPPAPTRELLDAARELLARRFDERLTLGQMGAALGCSPFHLCRAFAAAGTTVHRQLTALRLHAALDRVPARRRDLAALSLELGFCHHAHFTAAFRRAFGLTPTAWAARMGGRARS